MQYIITRKTVSGDKTTYWTGNNFTFDLARAQRYDRYADAERVSDQIPAITKIVDVMGDEASYLYDMYVGELS